MPASVHAAAPDGDAGGLRDIVEAFGPESADASELDIDNAAGLQADGLFGLVGIAQAFVETDRGLSFDCSTA